ncbi:STICHEL-like 3-like protein [Drosera capensis]
MLATGLSLHSCDLNQHLCTHLHLSSRSCIHLKHHLHNNNLHSPPVLMHRHTTPSLPDPSAGPDFLFKTTSSRETYTSLGRGRRRRRRRSTLLNNKQQHPRGKQAWNELPHRAAPVISNQVDRKKTNVKGRTLENGARVETILQQQSNDNQADDEDVASSDVYRRTRISHHDTNFNPPESSAHGSCTGFDRVKRPRFRTLRGTKVSTGLNGYRAQNDFSMASNSSVKGLVHLDNHSQYRNTQNVEENVTGGSTNRCGIHWNWSRIHHRGKSFLDRAGRSLSCGLADPKLNRSFHVTQGRGASFFPNAEDDSSSHGRSEAQELPLLFDGFVSQGSSGNTASAHVYSGELGLFANSVLEHDGKSDLASETHFGDTVKFRGNKHGMHQNLTQKYTPRTFRDLIGQNLVSQALSNAVSQRKIGMLYVFYGPHGTGKTSCACIFARALNCSSLERPKPCGFCGSCIAHDVGKSRNIKEVGTVNNFDLESFADLVDNVIVPLQSSQYRVLIVDDCDTLSADCWNALSKVIDRASRRLVFIFICSSLDVLPHIITSRCQKFFFPKLKDGDIMHALQWISGKECFQVDDDALKLIASRSDGSLRDAEMTLEQLSLLGQRISVALVQESAGLISDDKLVHLLDLALSADTVNTVKSLREIMETGVEPLALMSQLATVVTDILAVPKEDVEKLRQALKTLSAAEKQLRLSNDKLTGLTAALLQLDPNQQYVLPTSSTCSTSNDSPLYRNAKGGSIENFEFCGDTEIRKHAERSNDVNYGKKASDSARHGRNHDGVGISFEQISALDADTDRFGRRQTSCKAQSEIEEIWLEVLDSIRVRSIKEFMYKEGQLISVSYTAAPTVKLFFSSSVTKSKAEKFKAYILQAFESVLGSPVIIEFRCDTQRNAGPATTTTVIVPISKTGPSQPIPESDFVNSTFVSRLGYDGVNSMHPNSVVNVRNVRNLHTSEIEEVAASPRALNSSVHAENEISNGRKVTRPGKGVLSTMISEPGSISDLRRPKEHNPCQALVRSKVSLATVLQQAEGSTQQNTWTKRKAVSIAEKLEQENLRLEPRSRTLLCWRTTRTTRRKASRLRSHTRKSPFLLKLVSCGVCRSTKSSR